MTMPPRSRTAAPDDRQLFLPLSPVRNREFLSNHWLEHRLPLEPEWKEHRAAAVDSLQGLLDLWRVERSRDAPEPLEGNKLGQPDLRRILRRRLLRGRNLRPRDLHRRDLRRGSHRGRLTGPVIRVLRQRALNL
jgi:hypothetical protein